MEPKSQTKPVADATESAVSDLINTVKSLSNEVKGLSNKVTDLEAKIDKLDSKQTTNSQNQVGSGADLNSSKSKKEENHWDKVYDDYQNDTNLGI